MIQSCSRGTIAHARNPAADIFEAYRDINDKHDKRQQYRNQTFHEEFLTRRWRHVRGFDKLYIVCGVFFRKRVCKLKLLVRGQTAV